MIRIKLRCEDLLFRWNCFSQDQAILVCGRNSFSMQLAGATALGQRTASNLIAQSRNNHWSGLCCPCGVPFSWRAEQGAIERVAAASQLGSVWNFGISADNAKEVA